MSGRSNGCGRSAQRPDRPGDRGAWRQDRPDRRRLAAHRVRQHRRSGALCREGASSRFRSTMATSRPIGPSAFASGSTLATRLPMGLTCTATAVNVAARLQAECPPGGICVSRPVRDHVHDRLDLAFEELGSLNLKNIARPVEAFVLRPDADRDYAESAERSCCMARPKPCRCRIGLRSPSSPSPT